jgi:hypothetical protein
MSDLQQQQSIFSNPQGGGFQQPVPNATTVLVLGIISIAICWLLGIFGLACGIIALILGGKSMAAYRSNPQMYSNASYNNLKAGRVCAIIGTILSGLYVIYYLLVLANVVNYSSYYSSWN